MIKHVAVLLTFNEKAFSLKSPIQNLQKASFSSILTLAAWIVWKFPHLIPFSNVDDEYLKMIEERQQQFPPMVIGVHPYFEHWCSLIAESIKKKSAINVEQTIYIELTFDEKHQEYIEAQGKGQLSIHQISQEQASGSAIERLAKIFKLGQVKPNNRKVGIFNYSAEQLESVSHKPVLHIDCLFIGQLFMNEEWHLFNILSKQKPTLEELTTFDCLILTGSTFSVLDQHPQSNNSILLIKQALKKSQKLRVIGVCYGHQLISKHFNAPISKGKQINALERVEFVLPILQKHKFFEPILKLNKQKLNLLEFHEDYVEEVPVGFDLICGSKSCKVEGLISKDARILTFQFHSEYLTTHAQNYQLRFNLLYKKEFPKLMVPQSAQQERHLVDSSIAIRKVFSLFINQEQIL